MTCTDEFFQVFYFIENNEQAATTDNTKGEGCINNRTNFGTIEKRPHRDITVDIVYN